MFKSLLHARAAFIFVFITVALDMLAVGVMIPVLPKLVAQFQGGDLARASATVGLFGFAWALMQFLCQPVLGALSDRFGRRPVILLSNFGLGLDYVLMALSPNLGFLFAGRIISGVCAASVPTANAYISDITPPEARAGRFGMLGAAFGVGFVIGPAIGGPLGARRSGSPPRSASSTPPTAISSCRNPFPSNAARRGSPGARRISSAACACSEPRGH